MIDWLMDSPKQRSQGYSTITLITSRRLVINLIVINIVSCLFLLPSVAADLSTAEEPFHFKPEMNGTEASTVARGPVFALCVWGTAFSSFVSNASILAVLAVGE